MNDRKQMCQLTEIMALRYELASAKLAENRRTEDELRQNLSDLSRDLGKRLTDPTNFGDLAWRAGADIQWSRWADQRRARINTELARCLAEKEGIREKLRFEFGRQQAVEALASEMEQRCRLKSD